jgi:hypothetical protein
MSSGEAPPSPPTEKAIARQDQAGKSSARDGAADVRPIERKSVLTVEGQHAHLN